MPPKRCQKTTVSQMDAGERDSPEKSRHKVETQNIRKNSVESERGKTKLNCGKASNLRKDVPEVGGVSSKSMKQGVLEAEEVCTVEEVSDTEGVFLEVNEPAFELESEGEIMAEGAVEGLSISIGSKQLLALENLERLHLQNDAFFKKIQMKRNELRDTKGEQQQNHLNNATKPMKKGNVEMQLPVNLNV